MKSPLRIVTLLAFFAASFVVLPAVADDIVVKEKIQLLPSKDLSQFYTWIDKQGVDKDPEGVFSLQDGTLRVAGTARGYAATRQTYSSYRLVAEYKWGKAAPDNDSGIFVNCVGPDRAWMTSLEVQLATKSNDKSGDLVLLGGPTTVITVDGQPRKAFANIRRKGGLDYEKPIGEWNTIEIVYDAGRFQISLNGKVTVEGTDAEPRAGKVFLQSNKGEIFFRKVELLPVH
jgi:hypothetical protein